MLSEFCLKPLRVLLKILSIATLINIVVMYWVPVNIFLSSFSAVRVVAWAFIEKQYYLITVGVLICVLFFLTAFSISRKKILFPVVTLVYSLYDFVVVLSLLINGLHDGYWRMYVIQTLVAVTLIVFLCIYCWNYLQNNTGDEDRGRFSKKTGDGSLS